MKPKYNRISSRLAFAASVIFTITHSLAASFTWTQDSAATQTWTDTANWADITADTVGDVFVSKPSNDPLQNDLTFFQDTTTALTAGTNTINMPGAEQIGKSLTLNGKGADSGSATSIIIDNGGQTLALKDFAATRSIVNLNAMAGTEGLSYSIDPILKVYDGDGMDFNGNGTANFVFNNFNVDGFNFRNIVKSGTSALTLNFISIFARADIYSTGGALTITGTVGDGTTRAPKVIATGGDINWNAVGNFGGLGNIGFGVEGNASTFNYQGGSASYNGTATNGEAIFIAPNSGQTGTMNVTGGTIGFASNGEVWIGADGYNGNSNFGGTAVMNISGTGTIDTGTFVEDFRIGSNLGGSTGTGTLNLNTGGTLATARTITFGDNDVTKSVMNFNGGTFKANASTATLDANNGRVNIRNAGAIVNTNSLDITIARVLEHSDIGLDNATDGGLTKDGLGTLTLSGVNTYTGTTTINDGTLLVNSPGSLDAASAVAVNGTSTLGGTGTIGGNVTVAAAANLAPGASAGTLTITGNLDISAMAGGAGQLKYELDALAGTNDQIAVGGTLNIGTLALDDLAVTNLGGLEVGTYTLITSTGLSGTADGTTALIAAGFNGQLQTSGNNLVLAVTAAAGSAYDTWKAANAPGSNPDDDTDGDGVTNAVEFVLGGTSLTKDLDKLPEVSASGVNMTVTFKRAVSSIDPKTAVLIETSTDLATWNTAPSPYTVPDTAIVGPPVTVVEDTPVGFDTVTLSVPQAPDAKKFARLKVVITP
jgi:autotransporter-associated beta strand protein